MTRIMGNSFSVKMLVLLGDFMLMNMLFTILIMLCPNFMHYIEWENFTNVKEFYIFINLFYLPCIAIWHPVAVDRFSKFENIIKRTFYMLCLHAMFFVLYSSFAYTYYTPIGSLGTLLENGIALNNIITIILFYFIWWCGLCIWRNLVFVVVRKIRSSRNHKRRLVVFVGTHKGALELWKQLQDAGIGYRTLGYFEDEIDERWQTNILSGGKKLPPATYLGKVEEFFDWVRTNNVEEVYCCLKPSDTDRIDAIYTMCEKMCIRFYAVPNLSSMYLYNMRYSMMGNVMVMQERVEPLLVQGNRIIKRAFDIVVSGTFLITLFPFIFLFVAIVTKLTSPGPIFFKQERSGINGKVFTMYKFRSMRVNKDADKLQATENDPRKTKFGNFLRKSNIDELPQFINVFKGDMSVVGPRPHMLLHTKMYSDLIKQYMVRHLVKPGLTGWAQVTGYRGETKELERMEGRVRRDIYYIENWSLWLDIRIMFMTIYNAIAGDKNAY